MSSHDQLIKTLFSKEEMPKDMGVLISILLGIVGFTLSICVINYNIEATEDKVHAMLSDTTNFIKSENGRLDTLILGAKEDYRNYLDSLSNYDSIKIFNSKYHSINQSYSLEHDKVIITFDSLVHKNENWNNYFFKHSGLLYDRLFYSKDAIHLDTIISGLDKFYSSDLAEVSNQKKLFLNHYPKLLIWILFISMAIGFSFFLIPIFIFKIKHYKVDLDDWRKEVNVLFPILIIFILFIPLIISTDPKSSLLFKPLDVVPLFKIGIKSWGLHFNSIMPFIGPLFWLMLVFMMNSKVSSLLEKAKEENLELLESIRKDFETFFIVIAIFLGFTIFCTGNFVSVLNQLVGADENYTMFPSEFSITNGLMQTFFLIIIYLSINSNITYTQEKLKNSFPEKAATLKEVTKVKGALNYIKLLFAMFAPILGQGFQELLKLFST